MSATANFIHRWADRSDISARSVLVTIFGDTILPVTRELWLSQLFQLTQAFGFSDRLVRTSLFRLAQEGWVTNERVGRQSRYRLTDLAAEESAEADERIYGRPEPSWRSQWSLAFLEAPLVSPDAAARLREHLTWNGFVALSAHVLGSPTIGPARLTELIGLISPDTVVPIAAAEFADLDALAESGFFLHHFDLADSQAAYQAFIADHEPLPDPADSIQAVAARTMLIHDLRRIRLRAPDLPATVLPADWAGEAAHQLAQDRYQKLSELAAPALTEILGVDYPANFTSRFPRN